jgi:hypothetical protein
MTKVRSQNGILGLRLRAIREEVYGEDGISTLARALGIPERTWTNYEEGVSFPATLFLAMIEETAADSHWLLSGEGARFLPGSPQARLYSKDGDGGGAAVDMA